MTTKIIMTDGTQTETIYQVKGLNPYTDETPGVWTPESQKNLQEAAKGTRLVPSVMAGLHARMNAMADLPFTIYSVKDDKVLDDSGNYKNRLGFLPDPARVFALSEGGLVVGGAAYWFKGTGAKTGAVKELKYWIPSSVKLDKDAAKNNVILFERTNAPRKFTAEEVLYTWLLDPEVELGPSAVYPLAAALIAAQANGAITSWVRDYMLRGAIKAMLLMVDGASPPGEVDALQSWFNRFMTGARGLAWRVFNATGIKPTIIGDGLEALKDLSITKELRYEIHQALGTRHLLEDENLATANARERQFYNMAIVPDARQIQQSWNDQLLQPLGYHIEFEPERLAYFKEADATGKNNKAQFLGTLATTFATAMTPQDALRQALTLTDFEMSDEQMAVFEKALKDKEAQAVQDKADLAAQMQPKPDALLPAPPTPTPPPPPPPSPVNKALIELDRWRDKMNKAGKAITWHPVNIPNEIVKAINDGSLSFEQARVQLTDTEIVKSNPSDVAMLALAESINNMVLKSNV